MVGNGIDGLGNAVLNLASTIRDLGNKYYASNAEWEEFSMQVELLQGKHSKLASQLEKYGQDVGRALQEVAKLMLKEVKTLKKRRDREEKRKDGEETRNCCKNLCGIKWLATRRMGEIAFPKSIGYAIGDVIRAYDGIVEQLSPQQELEETWRLGASLKTYRACLSLDASFDNPEAVEIGHSPDRSKKTAIEPITLQLALDSTCTDELHQTASQVFLEFMCNNLLCHHHLSRLLQNSAWVMATLKFLENTSQIDKSFWEKNTIQGILPVFERILGDTQQPEFQIQAARTLRRLVSHKVNWETILGRKGVLHQLVNLMSQVQNAEVQCSGAYFFFVCSHSHNDSDSIRALVLLPLLLPVLVESLTNDRNALLQRQVARALQNFACAADTFTRYRILDSPLLLESLVASLTKYQDPGLQSDAAWAIANLASGGGDKRTREQIANFPKLLDNLESCLDQDDNPILRVEAARAMTNLAWTKDTLKLMRILAVSLEGKHDPILQEGAAAGLAALARWDDFHRDELLNSPGLLGNLRKSLDNDLNSGLQRKAATALVNLASTSDTRMKLRIVRFPLMLGSLVDSLRKRQNPRLQCKAALAIANLAGTGTDQATRNLIVNFPGLLHNLEISLDQDDNTNLQVKAVRALINLAKTKDIAKLLRVIAVSLEGIQDPSIQEEGLGLVEDLAREGDAVKDQILSCPGLLENLVKSLVDDVNSAVQSQAARALIVLTWTEDTAKLQILSSPVLLESLVASLKKCHNPDLQYYAAWVITNLALDKDKATKNKIANFPGLLDSLESSLDQDDNPNLRLRAARALIKLAWNKDTPKLLRILAVSLEGKYDPVLQEEAARGLAGLAQGDDMIEEQILSFSGLLENLVQSLDDDVNCGLQTQAARALVNLTCTKVNARLRILSSPRLLGSLKASLRKCGNPTLQSYAAWAIANLASASADKAWREQIVSFPGLLYNLETSLDQDDNPNLQVRAAKALMNLDWKDTSKLLRIFVALLDGRQDPELQEAAAKRVADLARGEDVIKEKILCFPLLLENLVKSLEDDVNCGVQTEAARALVCLASATNISIKVTLISPLVLGSVVGSLGKCHNPDLQGYAAWAIANLAGGGEDQEVTRKKLADFPGLLYNLEASLDQDDNPNLRVRAAKALVNLAWTKDTPKLLQTLAMSLERKQDPLLQEGAASGLSDLARGNDMIIEQIVSFPGLVENLTRSLDDDVNCGLQTQAAVSIVNLACASDASVLARILSSPSLLGSLVASLTKVQNPALQSYAAWAIANLASGDAHMAMREHIARREQIASFPGLLDSLENSLDQDDNPSLRVRAVKALVNFAWIKDTPKLLRILAVSLEGKQDPVLQQEAAGGLAGLAGVDDMIRDQILNFPGLLENLVKSVNDDLNPYLQKEAASALINLANAERTLTKVRMLSYPPLLGSLVASLRKCHTPDLQLSATWAIANLAGEGADQAARDQIANFPGLLEMLQNFVDLDDHANLVVRAARALVNLSPTKDTSKLLQILAVSLEGKGDASTQTEATEGLSDLAREYDDEIKDQLLCFPGLLDNLVKALDNDTYDGQLQKYAARVLLNLASSPNTSIKIKVLESPLLLESLVVALGKVQNPDLRWSAASAIANFSGAGAEFGEKLVTFPGLVDELVKLLDSDENSRLQSKAALSLSNLPHSLGAITAAKIASLQLRS